jgi:hypothetical protein
LPFYFALPGAPPSQTPLATCPTISKNAPPSNSRSTTGCRSSSSIRRKRSARPLKAGTRAKSTASRPERTSSVSNTGWSESFEDPGGHDELREDPTWATLAGKEDPTGEDRTQEADQGKPLASKATLGQLEHSPETEEETDRYHQITAKTDRIADLFVDLFAEDLSDPDEPIVLDLDATHDPLHGDQEEKFFHGYYDCYCYLPLYIIFCEEELLCAKLRRSNIDASEGCLPEVERTVERIRQKWPEAEIILRADSGLARERIMKCFEENGVDYAFGLAQNSRLKDRIDQLMTQVEEKAEETGEPAYRFKSFSHSTLESWSQKRRVVAKAEHLTDKANPHFMVSSLSEEEWAGKDLYEDLYCERGR